MSKVTLFAESLHHQWPLQWKLLGAIGVMTLIDSVAFRRAPLVTRVCGDAGTDFLTQVFVPITLALGLGFIRGVTQESFLHLA